MREGEATREGVGVRGGEETGRESGREKEEIAFQR